MKRLKILLVEDDDYQAELISYSIEKIELIESVQRAHNGEEGLKALEELKQTGTLPDMIVLDLNMPKMGGIEMLTIVKKDEDLQFIPVVILSTSDTDKDKQAAYRNHANSFLMKPMGIDEYSNLFEDFARYWCQRNKFVVPKRPSR